MTSVELSIKPYSGSQTGEKILRGLLEHPYRFPSAAVAGGTAAAVIQKWGDHALVLEILLMAGLFMTWLPFWVKQQAREDGKHLSLATLALALLGSLLQGRLLMLHLSFSIVALTLMPQYFFRLPFLLAAFCGLAPAMGSEYSHWLMVLAEPERFPWGIGIMRLVALTAIGVSFKLLAMQIHERAMLQARVVAAERNSGMMKERQRLAREIHDTLAQGFAGIVVHLETAEQIDPLTGSAAKPHLDLARSVARENLLEARRMLSALRPEILDERGLPEALDRVCHAWSARTGLQATFSVTGDASPMHPEIEMTILRAMQEALTNIAKHAHAKTAAVTLSYMEDIVVLDVQDDGKGFLPEPKKEEGSGLGLKGMRERTEALHGTWSVESVPGEGTTVSITLPVVLTTTGESVPQGIQMPQVGI